MDPGEVFSTALIAGQHEEAGTVQHDNDGENDPLDDDECQFSSTSLDELPVSDIFGNSESCPPSNDRAVTGTTRATETSSDFENLLVLLDQNVAAPEIANNGPTNAATTPPTPNTLHK